VRKERGYVWLTKEHEEGRRVCNLVSHPISVCLRLPHLDFLVAPYSPRLPLQLCTSVERLSFPSVSHEYTHHHAAPSLKLLARPPQIPKTTANPSSWRSMPDPAVAGAVSLRLRHMAELSLSISRSPRPCHCAHHQVQAALGHSDN
jgi:hypothetical protein